MIDQPHNRASLSPADPDITQLLQAMALGDGIAEDELFGALYSQLRRIAGRFMAWQADDHTLQPTALVNEAYLRVRRKADVSYVDRVHFLSVAAKAMRQLLVDHARKGQTVKRRHTGVRVGLDAVVDSFEERSLGLEALDEALEEFGRFDPLMAKAIELRYFGGASVTETAEAVGLPERTFERRWRSAKNYLRAQLTTHYG